MNFLGKGRLRKRMFKEIRPMKAQTSKFDARQHTLPLGAQNFVNFQ